MGRSLSVFVKKERKTAGLTQQRLAELSGVSLHFIRDIEQGKDNLHTGKVNQVLKLFNSALVPLKQKEAGQLKV